MQLREAMRLRPTRRQVLAGTAAVLVSSCGPPAPSPLASKKDEKAMKQRPSAVAFDVVETLFDLEALKPRFEKAGLPPGLLREWFGRMIRDAMALDATGVYQPFGQVARGTLAMMRAEQRQEPSRDAVEQIMAGFLELPAHPDVQPAFQVLKDAGVRAVCLTNGSADITTRLLQRNHLDALVERVISIDEVKRWKPNREVYLNAVQVVGVPADQLAMVAVHSWDIHGALRAGLTTGWASRLELLFHPLMGPPDVTGTTLTEVCKGLLALPG